MFEAVAPRWRKVWRDAFEHRARTLLVVAAIAIGLAGAGTILDAWALVERVTRDSYLASDPVAATLRTDSVDARLLGVVRQVPGVRDARARRTVVASVRGKSGWQTALLVAASDLADRRIGKLAPQAGTWPPRDSSIAIELSSTDFSGLALGDAATLQLGDNPPATVNVSATVRDVSVAPGWMEHVVYGFVTPATLAALGARAQFNEIQIVVDDRDASQEDVRRVAYAVKAAVEREGHPVRDVEVPVPGEHIHAAQMNSLLYTQGAFGVLALIVTGFLVVNLVAAMLGGQVREIGVMKTLGARPAQLAWMYLAYAAALGVLASAISLPIAMRLGRIYGTLKGEMLNFDVSAFAIPWWAIALQAVVGILVPVAAAALPVRRGCRAPVATALRDFGLDRDGADPSGDWSHRFSRLPRPTLLSIRNAFRKRQRMALTLLALATGGAVFLGAANLRRSVIGAVDLLFAPRRYDFAVRLAEGHDADSITAAVAGVDGVRGVESWGGGSGVVIRGDGLAGNAFPITAPPAATRLLEPKIVGGRWVATSDGDRPSVVVSRKLAQLEPSLVVGARVLLEVSGVRTTFTVVGVVNDGPFPNAYLSRETLARVTGDRRVSSIVVASKAPRGSAVAAQVDLIQRARAALDGAGMAVSSSQLVDESRRVLEDHLLMVVQFLSAMGWVMIVVGGMGLASTMSLAVLERTREIGVLRAIGARHGAIVRMVQTEGLVIAVLSWACAIPLSIPMSMALATAFSRVMLDVPVTWLPDGVGVATWLGLVVTIALVACAWPAVRATRVTIARALAYE